MLQKQKTPDLSGLWQQESVGYVSSRVHWLCSRTSSGLRMMERPLPVAWLLLWQRINEYAEPHNDPYSCPTEVTHFISLTFQVETGHMGKPDVNEAEKYHLTQASREFSLSRPLFWAREPFLWRTALSSRHVDWKSFLAVDSIITLMWSSSQNKCFVVTSQLNKYRAGKWRHSGRFHPDVFIASLQ